jgi:hypothetical protein
MIDVANFCRRRPCLCQPEGVRDRDAEDAGFGRLVARCGLTTF